MSCLLLEKLVPELRTRIWKYALTFETPLRHATGMEPFVEKFTATHDNRSGATESTGSAEVEDHIKNAEQRGVEPPLKLISTSLLTVNKRIYLEAIEVFYKANTIIFNPHLCTVIKDGSKHGGLSTSLRKKTDLELATHVVTRMGASPHKTSPKEPDDGSKLASVLVEGAIKSIFPRLKSATVFFYVDAATRPMSSFFAWVNGARKLEKSNVEFDGVGSMQAIWSHQPEIKLRVQHRLMMQHWEECAASPKGFDRSESADGSFHPTANWMYRNIMKESHHPAVHYDRHRIISHIPKIAGNASPAVDYDGFEFWTYMEWCQSGSRFKHAEKTLKDDGQGNFTFTT